MRMIYLIVPVRGIQVARIDVNGNLVFAHHPTNAPIVHFGGPLALSLLHKPTERSTEARQ